MSLGIFQSHFQTEIVVLFISFSLGLLGLHMSPQKQERRVMVQDEMLMLSHQLKNHYILDTNLKVYWNQNMSQQN